jgi:ADP-ribose pyrophosphatase
LSEETGYEAKRWELLTAGPSSSGLSNEIITFYLAADAVPKEGAELDLGEKIEVHEVSLRNLPAWLAKKKRAGRLIDYKIFAALYLAGVAPVRGRVVRATRMKAKTQTRGSRTVKASRR